MKPILLISLVYVSSTLASPIPSSSQSTNGSQCLAIIFSLVAFVSLLFAVKHIYLVRRRARTLDKPSFNSSATTDQPNSSFLCFSDEKTAKNSKLGFFVGFFGSPTWETRINVHTHPFRYSVLHHFRSSLGRSQSSLRRFSLYEFGKRLSTYHAHGVATGCTCLSSTLCTSHPTTGSQMPANSWDFHLSRTRRHTLPTVCESEICTQKHQQTRHASLKSSRRRRDSSSSSGQRLSINDSVASPLTPSPRTPLFDFSSSSVATCPPSSRVKSRAQVRRDVAAVPPLPPLPLFTTSDPTSTRETPDGTGLQLPSIPSNTHESTSINNLSNSALYTSNSTTTLKVKPAARTPSTHRRSFGLGRSPLRIVTLPEMSISEFGTLSPRIAPRDDGIEPLFDASSIERRSGVYPPIGLGRPSTWGERFKTTLGISDNLHKEGSPTTSGPTRFVSTRNGSNAPHEEAEELILEILRDLVEETSGWDSSLHMEDSFRSLVRKAGISPQKSEENMCDVCSNQQELTIAEPVTSPIEINLGLLELDAYRMQCAQDAQGTETRFLDYGMPLATLEEEEGEEGADVSSQVGLAW